MNMPMFTLVILLVLILIVTLERIRMEWTDKYQSLYAKVLHSAFFGTIGLAVFVIAIHFHSVFFPTETRYGNSVQQQPQPAAKSSVGNLYSPGE